MTTIMIINNKSLNNKLINEKWSISVHTHTQKKKKKKKLKIFFKKKKRIYFLYIIQKHLINYILLFYNY